VRRQIGGRVALHHLPDHDLQRIETLDEGVEHRRHRGLFVDRVKV